MNTGPVPARKRVVVALGGNAAYPPTIKGTAEEQLVLMRQVCAHLVEIIRAGWQLVLTHGNGPVVGNILYRMARTAEELPPMPMDVCVAHSQGGMGYMLQQSFANVLVDSGLDIVVSCVVTEVEVDADDPAFSNPTKPVGKFFSEAEAADMAAKTGWFFAEDSGRGWRRMVASPKPKKILDLKTIDALLDAGVIPIACGGGGVPVVHGENDHWTGVAAVIDKDLTSAMLAAHLHADALIMLTGVEQVALDFNKPTQRPLDHMTLAQARQYTADGQFPPGSMGPKIEAAISYLEELPNANHDGEVIITSLERAFDALMGRAGTHITCKAPIR
ncbi:MAG: carbamate kinase [Betaproteobacteria bacterium]|nr:carbamate kinase [Betaproteobacteria bacterium]